MSKRSELIRERLFECIHSGEISNKDLVKIFEHIQDILNIQTITSFKKYYGISYNGVKFKKNLRTSVQNIELIVDND